MWTKGQQMFSSCEIENIGKRHQKMHKLKKLYVCLQVHEFRRQVTLRWNRKYRVRSQYVPGSTSLPTEKCHSDQQDHHIPKTKKVYPPERVSDGRTSYQLLMKKIKVILADYERTFPQLLMHPWCSGSSWYPVQIQ